MRTPVTTNYRSHFTPALAAPPRARKLEYTDSLLKARTSGND
jgi:hypothetical protein